MAYGVSNVHVIYDATRPRKFKLVSSMQLESAIYRKQLEMLHVFRNNRKLPVLESLHEAVR